MKKFLRSKRALLLTGSVVVVAGIVAAVVLMRRTAQADYFTQAIQRGPIRNVVNATGTVQALLTVQVGSQVSGQIQALYADYNSVVKRGQLLAKIDPRNFEAQVQQAQANLASSQARVQTADAEQKTQQANLQSAKANLEAARVARDNTAVLFHRYAELQKQGVVSQNDYDNAKANAESAAAKYEQAASQVQQVEAQVNSSKAGVEQAKAQVEQARASLNQAQINLDYTGIHSPVDGVVVSRNVDVGQTVAASLQAPVLFAIANDLTRMQVNASVDEADIGNISDTADVRFTVDAYPNRQFAGRIAEIRLNPQTVQNVVTYSVIINVDNQRLELKPGMTANITVTVAQQDNVLKVPNAALRYLPPGVTRDQMASMLKQSHAEPVSTAKPPASTEGSSLETLGHTSPESAASHAPSQGLTPATRPGAAGDSSGQTPEQRRARFQQMQQLSPPARQSEDRQKMRGAFGRSGGGETGSSRQANGGFRNTPAPPSQTQMAPGQMWDPASKIRFPSQPQRTARPAIVWVLGKGKKPEARQVLLGITDGSATQLLSGELQEDDNVIVGDTTEAAPAGGAGGGFRPPVGGFGGGFGGGRPGGGGRF